MHTLLFNLYASLALTAGIGVIISKNPVHSVIFLILVFCNATGLLLLFKIELLAMMFIIIYVGAIAVLFLFVVMMLNIKINQPLAYTNKILEQEKETFLKKIVQAPIIMSILSFIFFMLLLSFILNVDTFNLMDLKNLWAVNTESAVNSSLGISYPPVNEINSLWNNQEILEKSWIMLTVPSTNIQSLGYLIYTYYFYYFFMASLILLIAMIGAIVLTMYKRKHASKKQLIYKQIARSFETAVSFTN